MIPSSDIFGLIDAISRRVASDSPSHGAHIAHLGSEVRQFLESSVFAGSRDALTSPSELFDVCHALDTNPEFTPHSEIREAVLRHRMVAANVLLNTHYEQEQKARAEDTRSLLREQAMSSALLRFLPTLRDLLPQGRFGPGTLREIAPQEFLDVVEEQIYVFDGDREDWELFSRLLPTDLRERFDPSENGIEIPEHFASTAEAMELLRRISERRAIPMHTLLDPANFVQYCKELHGFPEAMEFLAKSARKAQSELKRIDTASASASLQ